MTVDWNRWRDDFVTTIATLDADGVFINTSTPAEVRERPPGLFGRARKPEIIPGPYVVMVRTVDHVLLESVTAFPTERDAPLSDVQRQQLRAAGWLMPGDRDYEPTGGPALRVYIPASEVDRIADLTVRTYQILGVTDPSLIEVERGE